MTTLIAKPELKIQSAEDGVWLYFKTENGIHACLNMANMKDDGTITRKALTEWAREYAIANLPHSEPKAVTDTRTDEEKIMAILQPRLEKMIETKNEPYFRPAINAELSMVDGIPKLELRCWAWCNFVYGKTLDDLHKNYVAFDRVAAEKKDIHDKMAKLQAELAVLEAKA